MAVAMGLGPDLSRWTLRGITPALIRQNHPHQQHAREDKDPEANPHQGLAFVPGRLVLAAVLVLVTASAGTRVVAARIVGHGETRGGEGDDAKSARAQLRWLVESLGQRRQMLGEGGGASLRRLLEVAKRLLGGLFVPSRAGAVVQCYEGSAILLPRGAAGQLHRSDQRILLAPIRIAELPASSSSTSSIGRFVTATARSRQQSTSVAAPDGCVTGSFACLPPTGRLPTARFPEGWGSCRRRGFRHDKCDPPVRSWSRM